MNALLNERAPEQDEDGKATSWKDEGVDEGLFDW